MDRALKERIVGAVVLVVLAVLIVPVFLDGDSEFSDSVQESIVLPGQEEQSGGQKTVVLDRDRAQPVPGARQQRAEASEAQPTTPRPQPTTIARAETREPEPRDVAPASAAPQESKPQATAAEPAVETAAPSSPAVESATGMWAVQLGSFSNQENANRLAAELRKDGYAAFLSKLESGSKSLHRVRIGPQKDRESAEGVASKLAAAGHKGQVVPHP